MLVVVNKKALKKHREAAKLSMYSLSVKAGLGKNAISLMESKNQKCSLLRIKAIATVLKVDYGVLIEDRKS